MLRSRLIAISSVSALLIGAALPAAAAPTEVGVSGAWVKASQYSDHLDGMTGVFGKLTNKTNRTITLIGGTSNFAKSVDVHQVVNGQMSHKDGGIRIAPGKSAVLEPGGLHVMLVGLKKKILPGTKVEIRLNFRGAKSVLLKLTAKAAAAGDETYAPSPMTSPSSKPTN